MSAALTAEARAALGLAPDGVMDRYLCELAAGSVRELFALFFGKHGMPVAEVGTWCSRPAVFLRGEMGVTRPRVMLRYRDTSNAALGTQAGWEAYTVRFVPEEGRDRSVLHAGGLAGRGVIAEAARLWAGLLMEKHLAGLSIVRPPQSPFDDPFWWLKHPGGPAACGMEAELAQAMAGSLAPSASGRPEGKP